VPRISPFRFVLWIVPVVLILAWSAPAVAQVHQLRLVDDRGAALDAPVKVCFVHGLSTHCVDLPAGESTVDLQPFDVVRVDGPHHGPAFARRDELFQGGELEPRLVVPRKAHLRVRGVPAKGVTAALYPLQSPAFDRPAHRLDLVRGEDDPVAAVEIPSGTWVLALESRGNAPDLHLLAGDRAADPGGKVVVDYRPAAGWSLVLRAVQWETGDPVVAAAVRLTPFTPAVPRASGGGAPSAPGAASNPEARQSRTGAGGIALFSGIQSPLADASLRHPGAVEARADGIAGDPGDLVARDVTLEPGGTVEAAIRVDGEPRPGWSCTVLDRSNDSSGKPAERSHAVGKTVSDEAGLCRIERLAAGAYWFRSEPPETAEAPAAVERELEVVNDQTTRLDLDLSPIVIEGDVYRGDKPVPGYGIEVYWAGDRSAVTLTDSVAEAETDEDGAYQATVWTPGAHALLLRDTAGVTADSRRIDVIGPSERADFHLAAGNLQGVVVDLEGNPVPKVGVKAVWRTGGEQGKTFIRGAQADEQGRFSFPVEAETGQAELSVQDSRYETQKPVIVQVAEGTVLEPVILTVAKRHLVSGQLVAASGAPVAGGWVGLYKEAGGGLPSLLVHTRSAADGTFELPAPGDEPYLAYATGPGCPLTRQVVPSLPEDGLTLQCGPVGGTLRIHLTGPEGEPASGETVFLLQGGEVIPLGALMQHLAVRRLPVQTDSAGRLVVPELPPGTYEVYTSSRDGQAVMLQGFPVDLQGTVTVVPGGVVDFEGRLDDASK